MHTIDFNQLAEQRYSCRDYSDRAVEREKIDLILEAARRAPSACNRQPWHFYLITSPEAKDAVRRSYVRDWFKTAPLYIVVCADPAAAWTRPDDGKNHADIDAAIATEHICLAATSLGLATCWVCNFDPVLLAAALSSAAIAEVPDRENSAETAPSAHTPVAILPVGYPASVPTTPSPRRPLSTLLTEL